MKRGLFITIEKTGEKMGGSTQTARLANALTSQLGIEKVQTLREPGGCPVGEQLRDILLHGEHELSLAGELMLLMACRAESYAQVIKPALDDGKIVICDRYIDSTLAYQGAGRGWKDEDLLHLHHLTGSPIPDLTFVLHGTPHQIRSHEDRFERLDDKFYERVKQRMLELATSSDRYVLIHANQPPEVITEQMVQVLKERFPEIFKASQA